MNDPEVPVRRFALTAASLAQYAAAAVLTLAAFVVGYHSFAAWRFRTALEEAYRGHDAGNWGAVRPAVEEALRWRPDFAGARVLRAKMLCVTGELEAARQEYERLRSEGYVPPPVRLGLGVVYLRLAERAADGRATAELAELARKEFQAARGTAPEAEIGLGHVELLLAARTGDDARAASARGIFGAVRTALQGNAEVARRITREGLLDYYAGLGRVLASAPSSEGRAAAEAFRAAYLLSRPRWARPLANLLAMEARRFLEGGARTAEQVKAMEAEVTALRHEMAALWRGNRQAQEEMKEAWLAYSLAAAAAFGRSGNAERQGQLIREVTAGGFGDRREPYLMDALIRTESALREDPNPAVRDRHVVAAIASCTQLLSKLGAPADEPGREHRARALNALGWLEAWRGTLQKSEALIVRGLGRVTEALQLRPDDYVYNRNAAVLLKQVRRPPAAWQPYLEKARAAAAQGPWAEDFAAVERYLEADGRPQ
ncbi:MAG TPA: hypothetical protein VNO22_05085 [Planctomycetota bacterium]|nr:hypothetical protein [Planctomycetota bacterium]